MKITFVFPGIGAHGFGCFGKFWDCDATFMPHGLGLLAACCKQAGHTVDALDLRRISGWEEFCARVARDSAEVFGITGMSGDYDIACECARLIRQTAPRAKIVIGGVHASIAPDEASANPHFDHVVVGEGEIILPQMLADFEAGRDVERVVHGPRPNLDELPLPDRDLFAFEEGEMRSPLLPIFDPPFVTLMVNRGCPFRCTFCQPAGRVVFGGKVRRRSIDSVFKELNYLRDRYQFQSLLIHDDLFIMHAKSSTEFAQRYKAEGFTAPFICQGRADFIAKNPAVLLCDEPTGALDSATGVIVLEALEKVNRELGTLTVLITHNAGIAAMADRVIRLSDGRIVEERRNETKRPAHELSW